jgi:hypothetical protein
MSTLDEALAAALLPDAFIAGGSGQELFLQIHNTLNSGNTPTPSQLEFLRQAFSRVVTENLPANEAFGLLGKPEHNKPLFAYFWESTDADIRQMIVCVRYELLGRERIKGSKKEELIQDEFSIASRQTIFNYLEKHSDFVEVLKNKSDATLHQLLEELINITKNPT